VCHQQLLLLHACEAAADVVTFGGNRDALRRGDTKTKIKSISIFFIFFPLLLLLLPRRS
jgi:hypothetical protein